MECEGGGGGGESRAEVGEETRVRGEERGGEVVVEWRREKEGE